jgi:DNA-binding CsgD family transcriptional regulator
MIGREREQEIVERALAGAKRQRVPCIVRVAGESGVGKTYFLNGLAESLDRQGWLVLETTCHSVQLHTPFLVSNRVTAAALEKLGTAAQTYASGLEDGLASFDPTVARLAGSNSSSTLDPQSYDLVFLRLFEGIAVDRNIAILCDDAQWLDTASASAFTLLLQKASTSCIALVVCERTPEEVIRWDPSTEVELTAFDFSDSLRIVRHELPDGDPVVAEVIAHHAGGFPLEILSLCEEVRRGGQIDVERSLRSRTAKHLASLDVRTREFVQLCALLGDPLEHRLLSHIFPDSDELGRLVERADRYIVPDGGDLRFHHSMLAQSVIQTIAVPIPLRKRIVEALQAMPDRELTDFERIADQAAACGDRRLQRDTYVELAAEAERRQAPGVVIRASELAIANQSATEPLTPEFLIRYVYALRAFDREPDAVEFLFCELPKIITATHRLGEIVGILIVMLVELERLDQAISFYRRYQSAISDPAECARLISSTMWAAVFAFDDALFDELEAEFVKVERFASAWALANRANMRAVFLSGRGEAAAARSAVASALTYADSAPQSRFHDILSFAATIYDFREVGCEAMVRRLPELNQRFRLDSSDLFHGQLCDAWVRFFVGDWDESLRIVRENLRPSMPVARSSALVAIPAAIFALTGEGDEFAREIDWIAHAAFQGRFRQSAMQLLPWWLVRHSDPPLENYARQIASELAIPASATAIGYVPAGFSLWAIARSDVAVLKQIAAIEKSRDQSAWAIANWELARGLALEAVADPNGKDLIGSAADRFRYLSAPFLASFAASRAGKASPEDLALLERLGVEKRKAKTPKKTALAGAELTPREWDVARLVGKGATNRQTAESLFVSERTVEVHLGNVFGKLNLTSRAQLVRWLFENEKAS